MKDLLASVSRVGNADRLDRAIRALEASWRYGPPALEACWAEHDPDQSVSVLAALAKADLRCRFARGGRPTAGEYLERFPALRAADERALSLIYEEFCLREEQGEQPDPASFCQRYEPWRDSLASQLKYHHLLSRVVGLPTAPPRFPEPGEHFREFAIDSVLGQGGAARVYRARNDLLGGREVALKVSPDRGQEPSIMGRLDHDHIVPVHNVVIEPETQLRGLIMPYRPGLPLDEVIRRLYAGGRPTAARVFWDILAGAAPTDTDPVRASGRAGWRSFPMQGTYAQGVAWIIATLAGAVAHAHARGIQHRDIKPANVLLTCQDGPQLLDFNLAHDPHAAEQAEAALRGGTLPYMAPEQLEAFIDPDCWGSVTELADLYSLGLVMHELLTGVSPEAPDQKLPLPRAISSLLDGRAAVAFAPRRENPSIPHALEAITIRCLEYRSGDRYSSAAALADDLQRFLDLRPLSTAVNPSTNERLENWTRRHWLGVTLAAAGIAASSYFAIPRFYPLEHRRAFLDAQTALDEGNADMAIRLLEPLYTQFPDAPLVRIHYAAALALGRKVKDAADVYGRTMGVPQDVLDACRRRSPETVRRLESLGLALAGGEIFSFSYAKLAREALNSALALGSTSDEVLYKAAVVDEWLSDFVAARAKLGRAIPHVDPSQPSNRYLLVDEYQVRARVTIKLAGQREAPGTPRAWDEARSLYHEALADLDRGRSLNEPLRPALDRENRALRDTVKRALGRLDAQAERQRRRHGSLQTGE